MDADPTRIRQLNEIGIALSAERDHDVLLERILSSARALTDADAGTLYTMDAQADRLDFAIVQNDTLGIYLGGPGTPVGDGFPGVALHQSDGTPNDQQVAAYAVLSDVTVNIEDAYDAPGFDFSGTRRFDQATGYRSRALLTVPMHDHEGEIVAVLQLLNKQTASGVDAFTEADRHTAESLASQAAVAITNQRLIDGMQALFDSFTRVIARAIDAKSAHTGAHCRRVPAATLMLAEAANRSADPVLADFSLTDDDRYELSTAAWLHDCGKVVTPHHVMEKSTKLEGIFDRLALIEARFAVRRQAIEQSAAGDRQIQCQQLAEDLERVRQANRGDVPLTDEAVAELERIAALTWTDVEGHEQPLLSDDELNDLCIRRGTLNDAERRIIEGHMTATLDMLGELPFPRHLQRVPEYAGGHHERMDGTGYPKGLTREELSVPARMMGIADVFEALTAPDRPYKAPMKLSQALTIMGRMVEDNHLDPDLFRVFVDEGVYREYAEAYLDEAQIDTVEPSQLPGLTVGETP
jgi:HD-GYP domain-containing protein (c-di-GMP phosphodiesterase class II)